MADLIQEQFSATSTPSGWTVTTTGDGAVTFNGSTAVVSAGTGTAFLRSPVVNMSADGDTVRVKVDAADNFNGYVLLRQSTVASDFNAGFNTAGSANYQPVRFRETTGAGSPPGSLGTFARVSPQWFQFRRLSSTQIVLESAPDASGLPGTWTVRATLDNATDLIAINMAATQIEFRIDGGAGSLTIDRVGDGSGGGSSLAAVLMRRRSL